MHEGKNYSVFLSKIENSYLLAVVFSRYEKIGVVRLFAKRACQELLVLVREYEVQNQTAAKKTIGKAFSEKLAQQFSDIYPSSEIK